MARPHTTLPPFRPQDIKRFWTKVDIRGPDECWPWKRSSFKGGYGQFKVMDKSKPVGERDRNLYANRVVYFLTYGVDLLEKCACHRCDNPPCCNPAHLFAGTDLDNKRDAEQKGRIYLKGDLSWTRTHLERLARGDRHGLKKHPEKAARGEQVWRAKLTEAKVREIRLKWATGGYTQQRLANEYGIPQTGISAVVRRKTWKHVI